MFLDDMCIGILSVGQQAYAYLNLDQPHQGDIASRKVTAPDIHQHEDQGAGQEWEAEEGK